MNKERAKENVKSIASILENLNIKWWLDAGTCLGAIREKDFIDDDDDTDIGLMIEDSADVWYLSRELLKQGFSLIGDFGTIDNGYEFSWRKWGIKTDFFFYYKKDNIVSSSVWKYKKQIIAEYDKKIFENLKEINFLGFKAFVPNPPEEYLTARYGNWKEVVKDWNWATGPLNINWERSEITKEQAGK